MTTKKDVLLIRAARSGDIKRVQALLAAGADANTSDHDGTTALMFAALRATPRLSAPACSRR